MAWNRHACFVCGAPVYGVEEHSPYGRPGKWTSRFKTLYASLNSWGDARISGVGKRLEEQDFTPLDDSTELDPSEHEQWVETELNKTNFAAQYPAQSLPRWGFPLHCSCLQLLQLFNPRLVTEAALQALFEICRSQPVDDGKMSWGHDYGGIVGFDPPIHTVPPGEEARLLRDYIPRDPDEEAYFDEIDEFEEIDEPELPERLDEAAVAWVWDPSDVAIWDVLSQHQGFGKTQLEAAQSVTPVGRATSSDPFRLLPPELITEVFCSLQCGDVCSLRLASRICAASPLGERFWRSRFLPGKKYEYFQSPISTFGSGDKWRVWYAKAKAAHNHPAMVNRKRIWALVSGLNHLVEHSLSSSAFNLVDDVPGQRRINLRGQDARGLLTMLDTWLERGSRVLRHGTLVFGDSVAEISVSIVRIFDKRYISGLKLTESCGRTVHLGYHHRSPESRAVCWKVGNAHQRDDFAGFHVAFDARGIRGLCAVSRSAGLCPWVGDRDKIPKRVALFPQGKSVHTITAGFDALKLVLLSAHGSDKGARDLSPIESSNWFPGIPEPPITPLAIPTSYRTNVSWWCPYHYCLFGGTDGHLLPALSSIVVWTVEPSTAERLHHDHGHIYGMKFCYSGSEIRDQLLGRMPTDDEYTKTDSNEIRTRTFNIDSANGERITSFDVYGHSHQNIISFETNYGRSSFSMPSLELIQRHSSNRVDGEIVGVYSLLDSYRGLHGFGLLILPPGNAASQEKQL